MEFVVFTFDGYGLPIAHHLKQEGCDVSVAVVEDHRDTLSEVEKKVKGEGDEEKRRRLSLYDGLLDVKPASKVVEKLRRSRHPEESFLFFDLNHLFRYSEELQGLGFHGNFPTAQDYLYEIDRAKAKEFVRKEYKKVISAETKRFSKASEAIAFLKDSSEVWVLKGLEENARAVVPDVEDVDLARAQVIDALIQHPEEYESAGFILELLIRNVVELTPEKLFYDGKPIATLMCIENKPIGAGNIGPMTDCAQDLVFETDPQDKINQIAFPPVIDQMAKDHKGLFVWDASLLIDSRSGKVYFGEYCANRFGYNSFYSELALAGSTSKFFRAAVNGKNPFKEHAVAASVRLFNFHRDEHDRPLRGAQIKHKESIERDLWLYDARVERDAIVTSGYSDTIAVLTGGGKSVSEAARRAYKGVEGFSFEGAFYRPEFDFVSCEYPTSIRNRLEYALKEGFFGASFGTA